MSERGELRAGQGGGAGYGPRPGASDGLRFGLRFGLLGTPVLYDATGEPRPVRSAKGRALLAALLLDPDRAVPLDALKDALWGDSPPASARASLQNHVTRLRRLLDDPERLHAVPPGYRLRVREGELDVRVFEHQVARARAAHAERDWTRVVDSVADALALWRGRPLSGLPDPLADHSLVPRLEEARLLALEWRYDAELELGTGLAALAPELAALVAEHPLRETFHRQLMLVLHRTGRQAEALAAHRELRRKLVEELGVEPGAAVRDAHQEVLRGRRESAGGSRGAGPSRGRAEGRRSGDRSGDRPADWLGDRPGDRSGERPADRFGGRPGERPVDRPAGRLGDRPADRLGDRPADRSGDWLGDRLASRSGDRSVDRSGDWPGDRPGDRSGDRSGDRPGGRSADRLGDRSGGWSGDRPADRSGDWLGDRSADRLGYGSADRPADRPADRSGDRPADRSGDRPADRSGDWPGDRSGDQPADRFGGRSADRSADRSGDWPGDRSGDRPGDESVDLVRRSAHRNIGYAHLTLGEPAAALAHFEESLRGHGEYEDWHGEAQARLGLVRALRGLTRVQDATRECAALLDRAERRGDARMTGLARHQRGLLLRAEGRDEEAYEQWRSALAVLDGTDSDVTDELRTLLTAD